MLTFLVSTASNTLISPAPRRNALAFSIVVVTTIVYAIAIARWAPVAMQDLPNHVARAAAIGDIVLHDGHGIGAPFQFHFMTVPYIMHDLLLAMCVQLFGTDAGGSIWAALVCLALPFSLVAYARTKAFRGTDLLILFLIGLYLGTNTSFWKGFLAYCLALPITLFTMAAAELWRQRASWAHYALYVALVIFGYLTHLTAALFSAAAVGIVSVLLLWRRQSPFKRELQLLWPVAAVFLWHVADRSSPDMAQQHVTPLFLSAFEKARGIAWNFVRFDRLADVALLCLALGCFAVVFARSSRSAESRSFRIEMLLVAAVFAFIYLVLPHSIGVLSWLDQRATPMLAVFVILACFSPPPTLGRSDPPVSPALRQRLPSGPLPLAFGLAALLAVLNLAVLGLQARRAGTWLTEYRQVSAKIPRGAWVLPVYTSTSERSIRSTLHSGDYALLDSAAPIPYFFSRNFGDAMVYFSYREVPYAPEQFWYIDPPAEQKPIDWATVAKSYQFLLVAKPFDPSRIPLDTSPVTENAAAVLLAIKGAR